MQRKILEIILHHNFMFPFNLFRKSSTYRMENLIGELSELCLDLGDDLRRVQDEEKRKKLLSKHLEKVTALNKENNCKIPDFLPGLEWINVKEPLSIYKHLQGKIVVLDFFTYCCINCMHILPELRKLEELYPVEDGLVVIGVHSAKFTNERITSNIQSAVGRYEIQHPVVNDNKEAMWRALSVHCWPTLYVIGPRGEPLLFLQGEGHYDTLRVFISQALEYYSKVGLLSKKKLSIIDTSANRIHAEAKNNTLLYPGKVTISSCGNFIAIADSGHHRIIVADLNSNEILHIIGGPNPGLTDGKFDEAKFFSPQGLTFFGENTIFVADTENHCIRQIDIKDNRVVTVIGDGCQGRDYEGGKTGASQQISSPWDVCIPGGESGKICFIAMAGTHQIWAYFLEDSLLWKKTYKKGTCAAVVGSGREENRNNHYPMSSGLAQPSGLTYRPPINDNTTLGGSIYFADSESSTVRQVDLLLGRVSAVVGGAIDVRNLFAYGDSDGKGLDVKLQHPLGVAYCSEDDKVYVADTYNHKIKIIDPENKTCTTVKYTPSIKLNEPGGLYAFGDKIFIADTNNHSIRVLNIKDKTVSTIELKGGKGTENLKTSSKIFKYTTDAKLNKNGGAIELNINTLLPQKTALSEGPSQWNLTIPGQDGNNLKKCGEDFSLNPKWSISMNKELGNQLTVNGRFFICNKDDKSCSMAELDILVNVEYTDNGPETVQCNLNCEL
ncbi:hypothetical protein O3M35_005996 [Rhynocoris fuscipes]|uniref:Thioredoxin domain-containing protein n=1 Tax=Rhynocoris fuscipes TaxID=488301 RepID=A0AAW1DCC6_9HEMI